MCKLKFLRLRRVAFCTLAPPPPRPGSVTSCAAAMHWPDLWKCLRHCLLPAALQPRRFCQFSVTLMGLIIFELCSCTVFFSSIFVVFYFSYFVGLTIHKFVFEVGPKGRRQPGEKNHCCCCCCCRYLLLSLQLPLLL